MSSNQSRPDYYKNEITDEDQKKLEEIIDKVINDKNAFDFREPVDYEGLNLLDYIVIKYPTISRVKNLNEVNKDKYTPLSLAQHLNNDAFITMHQPIAI